MFFSSDLKECLLRQLEALGSGDPLLKQMIKEHLEDVAHGNIGHISRSLKIPTSQVRKYMLMIGTLNPRPSTGFGIKKNRIHCSRYHHKKGGRLGNSTE
ncbi:hypothetical protein [Sellimonas intestinalis]|uniref:RNA polymerase factor sigma-54 n=1 Tax=Sellimonas intestinalis TaxID=1653434 RepID=UPI0039A20F0F